ncbi:actin maturation protease isoform X3 [Mustela nigripes]|uniref:actin maturation protease isoform X3 n=1 Tax=Mustela nigripes TaxID=77151 RepID=UPI0028158A76|nr:actin maturation protease isoform X3 [Mustela nigripes]XP_059237372.1 actin maturation protease isoform X3 [Mustela nigripes]
MDPLLCRRAVPHPGRPSVWAGGLVDGRHTPGTTQRHPPRETCGDGHGERLHGPGRDVLCYDEDFNHEPCHRKGHKAHWAVSTGVLLGVRAVPSLGYSEDPELPGLFHPVPTMPHQPPALPEEGSAGVVYLLSKQGKSWHYQLWDYDQVRDSNLQLTDFSPSRAADGRAYVVPAGGVRAGLCGQALLLRPRDSGH